VGVVILNWRHSDDTIRCVESLLESDYPDLLPVIVDNDSGDGSEARLRAAFPALPLVQTGANLGYAGGNNRGIERVLAEGAEYVLVLNNDTRVERDCIARLVGTLEADRTIGQVGPKVIDAERGTIGAVGGEVRWAVAEPRQIGHPEVDRGQYSRIENVDYVPGTAVLVRGAAIRQVGLLPEEYFLYFEDVVWSLRFRRHGWRTVADPGAVVHHWESTSTGPDSPLKRYYMVRNNLYFADEWLSPLEAAAVRRRIYLKFVKWALRTALSGRARQVQAMFRGYADYRAKIRGMDPRLPG
jgi:GT2 family glycosyltransferase